MQLSTEDIEECRAKCLAVEREQAARDMERFAPAIKGGQGRTAARVDRDAVALWVILAVCAAAFGALACVNWMGA